MLKGKLVTLKEALNSTELETKASRETIMRLVSEVGKEQKVATRYTSDLERLRVVNYFKMLKIYKCLLVYNQENTLPDTCSSV